MAGILLETENVTDEERAKHAKSTATAKRAEVLRRPQRFTPDEIQCRLEQAAAVGPTVLEDLVVARGAYYSGLVGTGEHLRIIDLQGLQAVDFLCYDRNETQNRYNAANTIKLNRSIYVSKGFRLYSDRADVLIGEALGGRDEGPLVDAKLRRRFVSREPASTLCKLSV
jgi:uncharacterized protein